DRPLLDRPLELPTIVDSARPIVEPGTTTGTTIAATIKAAATNSSRRRARLVTADSAISVISPTTNAIVGPLDPAATSATNSTGTAIATGTLIRPRIASRCSERMTANRTASPTHAPTRNVAPPFGRGFEPASEVISVGIPASATG